MSAVSKRAKATSPSWSVSASMASTTWLSNVRCRANTGASQRWMMRSQGLCGPAGGGSTASGHGTTGPGVSSAGMNAWSTAVSASL